MNRSILTGAAILAYMSSAAFAQTSPATPPKEVAPPAASSGAAPPIVTAAPNSNAAATPTAPDATNGTGLRQQLTANLEKAGYTDVKVAPDSFVVQAKDAAGNPVTMFLDTDSMSVFTNLGPVGDAAQNTPDGAAQKAVSASLFTNIPPEDDITSQVVGLDVYNNEKQDIGAIKDIAFSRHGVKAYVLGVGGFLGMGDHYVAVRPSAITLTYDASEKKWHAKMNTTADQLKAAPEYKYSS
jgi:hypothetical protein